jgi:hypothetical protein
MKRTRHTPEQIIRKLKMADQLIALAPRQRCHIALAGRTNFEQINRLLVTE